MATNQESLQASLRARSGSTDELSFNEDWIAVFDADAIDPGMFNERLLMWINAELTASYTSLLRAQSEYAASQGVTRWSDLTTI